MPMSIDRLPTNSSLNSVKNAIKVQRKINCEDFQYNKAQTILLVYYPTAMKRFVYDFLISCRQNHRLLSVNYKSNEEISCDVFTIN